MGCYLKDQIVEETAWCSLAYILNHFKLLPTTFKLLLAAYTPISTYTVPPLNQLRQKTEKSVHVKTYLEKNSKHGQVVVSFAFGI